MKRYRPSGYARTLAKYSTWATRTAWRQQGSTPLWAYAARINSSYTLMSERGKAAYHASKGNAR